MADRAQTPERPAVRGASHMTSYPNPRYYGLKGKFWKEVQRCVDELQELHVRESRHHQRKAELQRELEYQKRQLADAYARAARAGEDDPDDKYLRLTEREIEKVNARLAGVDRARHEVERELRQVVMDVPEEVVAELRERGRKHEERYHELVAEAMRERDQLGTAYSLHMWARGTDERGRPHQREGFRGVVPPSPATDSSPWYAHPLNWCEQREPEAISTQSAAAFVGDA